MGYTVMSNINFDNPYLLLIAVPLIVLFTIPFVIAVRKDNRNGHNITSQILHVLLAVIIGFAAAGTTVTTVLTETQVYIVADVSYSANKNLDTIDNIIRDQLILPRNSKVGLITFGKDYELLSELGDQKKVKSVKESTVDDSETNIAEALEYADRLFTDNAIKRVVLITDGKQTDEVDTYAMRRAVDMLEDHDVKVDAYFLDDNLSSDVPEVQISGAEFTPSAFINHREMVAVSIQSNCETRGRLVLYKDGEEYDSTGIELTEGKNMQSFELYTKEGGTFDYEVRLENMEKDTSDFNNSYSFTQSVSSELNVLIITHDWNNLTALVEQYKDSATIDVFENCDSSVYPHATKRDFLTEYLNNSKVNIYNFDRTLDAVNATRFNIIKKDVPYTVEELCKYDEIVLSEFNITTMEYASRFVASLDTVVGTFGKSLVTLGDTGIQSAEVGNDDDEPLRTLDKMLPVRYGRSDDAPKLYTIVIDQSISMWDGRLEPAKDLAKRLVGILDDTDYVYIVAFWGENQVVYGPRPLTDASSIVKAIDSLELKQGTNVFGALNEAFKDIKDYNASQKSVMLITDGRTTSETDRTQARNLVSLMADGGIINGEDFDGGIATSVIEITGNGGGAGSSFLSELASLGHGEHFTVGTGTGNGQIDDVTFAQIAQKESAKVFEQPAVVKLGKDTDEVLSSIPKAELSRIPEVSGYITSVAKASATSVLNILHTKSNDTQSEIPLYAYWNYGTGKVATFTSAFSGDWIRNWSSKSLEGTDKMLNEVFFDSVMYVNIPDEKTDYPYSFSVTQDGTSTRVQIAPPEMRFAARARLNLIMPDGEVVNRDLVLDGNNYNYTFTSAAVGRYQIEVTYEYNGAEYKATSVLNVSYASEYDEFASFEASPLFRAINGRGQVVLGGQMLIENAENEVGVYTNDFTVPLLIMAVVLFVVDIIVRKLKWEDIKSFFGGYKKSGGKKA